MKYLQPNQFTRSRLSRMGCPSLNWKATLSPHLVCADFPAFDTSVCFLTLGTLDVLFSTCTEWLIIKYAHRDWSDVNTTTACDSHRNLWIEVRVILQFHKSMYMGIQYSFHREAKSSLSWVRTSLLSQWSGYPSKDLVTELWLLWRSPICERQKEGNLSYFLHRQKKAAKSEQCWQKQS